MFTLSKQYSRYLSSKDGFIWEQQMNHVQDPGGQEKNTFIVKKKELGRAIANREFMTFHWLSPIQERKVFLFPVGFCYHCRQ